MDILELSKIMYKFGNPFSSLHINLYRFDNKNLTSDDLVL